MKKLDSWSVAAAILLMEESGRLHYTTLTRRVLQTDLTTLGEKGRTPEQTLGAILRKESIFSRRGGGYYGLSDADAARRKPAVEDAIERIQTIATQKSEKESLHREIELLREQNERLGNKLAQISEICEEE